MVMVKIIADSIYPNSARITTYHCRYWRAIHSELMTHRDFSRNARSSRAVPSITLLSEEIFIPQFGMNKKGMQSDIIAPPYLEIRWACEWELLANTCRWYVRKWSEEGMHKQHANRPLEWFGWIDTLITSVRWNNFWELRISDYAQPELNILAALMKADFDNSRPCDRQPGEWHLPYISLMDRHEYGIDICKKLSTARCARLSYRPFDGNDTIESEIARYESLVINRPVHASPAEHQATADTQHPMNIPRSWDNPGMGGNFGDGWIQHRQELPYESIPG